MSEVENYVVINGERHDLVITEGCNCGDCSIFKQCRMYYEICKIFDKKTVTRYDGYHFNKHSNN